MKNPIGNVGLFHTPESMKELEDWLMGTSKATGAGPYITTAAMMAWNLAGKYVEKNMKADLERKAELSKHSVGAWKAAKNGGV